MSGIGTLEARCGKYEKSAVEKKYLIASRSGPFGKNFWKPVLELTSGFVCTGARRAKTFTS